MRGIWLSILAVACGPKAEDTSSDVTLPEEEAAPPSETGFSLETGLSGDVSNMDPVSQLELRQEGIWELTPLGGPFTALTGSLEVTEILDGQEEVPACWARFSLTGEALGVKELCEGCTLGFTVRHYLVEEGLFGDSGMPLEGEKGETLSGLSDCMDPELPQHDTVWQLAWQEQEQKLMLLYPGTKTWIPWYQGELTANSLSFSWTSTVGVVPQEEEEE